MSEHADRVWSLYAVPDTASTDGVALGEIIQNGQWELRVHNLSALEHMPGGAHIRWSAELWLTELAEEIDAANGAHNNAPPMTPDRMEWRRAFHNNHLRIGPARQEPRHLAA
ncbi:MULTISPECIES: hypothetical protein [Nesterenkonia]|uniref:Uncharacterized protein n=2 Tax=Nesterenkonia TaxID=57494 RepID=A0ABT2HPQ1_9MICC|nr:MULTISPECIES: hypothetical protein [Nesterenkonia]MCT1606661.1 hypothetical protein [Nesterenkonia massiliensis]MDR5712723.1 hypothetical protein [Nesterenkonia flava]